MSADDYGRFDADPAIVLAIGFPLQVLAIGPEAIESGLQEGAKIGLWTLYRVGDDKIGQMYKWEQRIRANKSRFPPPNDGHMSVIRMPGRGSGIEELGSRKLDRGTGIEDREKDSRTPDDYSSRLEWLTDMAAMRSRAPKAFDKVLRDLGYRGDALAGLERELDELKEDA